MAVRPGDDFFLNANGNWIARTPIPADAASVSLFSRRNDILSAQLRNILEGAAGDRSGNDASRQAIGAFYRAYMDEGRIERLGGSPIATLLRTIGDARDHSAIAELMGRSRSDLQGSLFDLQVAVDENDARNYVLMVGRSGTVLPDRDDYLEASHAATRQRYRDYIARMLSLAGWPHAAERADDLLAFETRIAKASWSSTERRDAATRYNPMSLSELQGFAPDFPWRPFLGSAGVAGARRIVIDEKSAYPELGRIYRSTPTATLRAWLAFQVVDNAASYLSSPFASAHFEFHVRGPTGQAQDAPRWRRGVRAVAGGNVTSGDRLDAFGNLGWSVGKLYVAKYFDERAKGEIADLAQRLKTAYRARLAKAVWLSPQARAEALRKIDRYSVKVGYPDVWPDYRTPPMRDDDLIGDVRRAADAQWEFERRRLDQPVDDRDWRFTPQSAIAYQGRLHDIVFTAAFLQEPVFNPGADPAVNFGSAGQIIGHELSHGFDDQGRHLDAEGRRRDWWTAGDARTFNLQANRLAAQYSGFEPLPGRHVNGALTLSESIADLAGLSVALDAYHAALGGKPAPVLGGLSGDQRFFLGFAQLQRGKTRDAVTLQRLASDEHAPNGVRVNGSVRNVDEWYRAFAVRPGDRLYLSPQHRVRIY